MKSIYKCNSIASDFMEVGKYTPDKEIRLTSVVSGRRSSIYLTPSNAVEMGSKLQSLAAEFGHCVPCTTDTVEVASKEPLQTKVTAEQIDAIMRKAKVLVSTEFEKCTVVTVKLPNGFTITESSGCVDVANYNVKLGTDICLKKIRNKVWELEGYALQKRLSDMGVM
ncbi:Gp49 family protein [Bacillus wiedmannii]|uniref:Gp49 family protein n=1 Tax=Bacillus wiedmannii TaxID=1890302 RepID=UPI001F0A3C63|nr:Gp49 family protein [Bacillus wiedmannii]